MTAPRLFSRQVGPHGPVLSTEPLIGIEPTIGLAYEASAPTNRHYSGEMEPMASLKLATFRLQGERTFACASSAWWRHVGSNHGCL